MDAAAKVWKDWRRLPSGDWRDVDSSLSTSTHTTAQGEPVRRSTGGLESLHNELLTKELCPSAKEVRVQAHSHLHRSLKIWHSVAGNTHGYKYGVRQTVQSTSGWTAIFAWWPCWAQARCLTSRCFDADKGAYLHQTILLYSHLWVMYHCFNRVYPSLHAWIMYGGG